METIPLVRSSAFAPLAAWLGHAGAPGAAYLESAGIPAEALDQPQRWVPERAFWALLERVRDREGVEDVGFRVGASHHVTDLETVDPLLRGQPTLLATMRAFCDLLAAHNNAWDYWLERSAGGVRLCRRGSPIDVGAWPVEQYVVSYLVDLVRMAAGPSWWPLEIWLQAGGALLPAERRWLRAARLHSGGPVTAIAVPGDLLAKRPAASTGEGPSAVDAEPGPRELAPILRQVLRTYLPDGRARLVDVGEVVGLEPRTLQRRLAHAGTSFQRVLDAARLDLARARLEAGAEPITEIAFDLGYREVSSFGRSFRRLTGVTPRAYRKANRPSPVP